MLCGEPFPRARVVEPELPDSASAPSENSAVSMRVVPLASAAFVPPSGWVIGLVLIAYCFTTSALSSTHRLGLLIGSLTASLASRYPDGVLEVYRVTVT